MSEWTDIRVGDVVEFTRAWVEKPYRGTVEQVGYSTIFIRNEYGSLSQVDPGKVKVIRRQNVESDWHYNIRTPNIDPRAPSEQMVLANLAWYEVSQWLVAQGSPELYVVDIWIRATLHNTVTSSEWLSLTTPHFVRQED